MLYGIIPIALLLFLTAPAVLAGAAAPQQPTTQNDAYQSTFEQPGVGTSQIDCTSVGGQESGGCAASDPKLEPEVLVVVILAGVLGAFTLVFALAETKLLFNLHGKFQKRQVSMKQIRGQLDTVRGCSTHEKQFSLSRKRILDLLSHSKPGQKLLIRNKNDEHFTTSILLTGTSKNQTFHSRIEIQGSDSVGEWKGSGSILCQNEATVLWFTQEYYEHHLQIKPKPRIFLSQIVGSQMMKGRWWMEREPDEHYGTWVIGDPSISASQSQQQIGECILPNSEGFV